MLAVNGSDGPFSFIWTRDLTRVLVRAIATSPLGVFNVAADGVLSVHELAQKLGKPVLRLPVWGLKALDNSALKVAFVYTPELTSRQVFDLWQKNAGL